MYIILPFIYILFLKINLKLLFTMYIFTYLLIIWHEKKKIMKIWNYDNFFFFQFDLNQLDYNKNIIIILFLFVGIYFYLYRFKNQNFLFQWNYKHHGIFGPINGGDDDDDNNKPKRKKRRYNRGYYIYLFIFICFSFFGILSIGQPPYWNLKLYGLINYFIKFLSLSPDVIEHFYYLVFNENEFKILREYTWDMLIFFKIDPNLFFSILEEVLKNKMECELIKIMEENRLAFFKNNYLLEKSVHFFLEDNNIRNKVKLIFNKVSI